MFDDMKADMKDVKTITSLRVWFDRYAKRIEQAARSQRRSGAAAIQRLRRQSIPPGVDGRQDDGNPIRRSPSADHQRRFGYGGDYGNGGYRYGAYGGYGGTDIYGMGDVKAVGAERRVVRAEEKSIAATDVQQIRQEIIAATADIRRKMTQKYQIEF